MVCQGSGERTAGLAQGLLCPQHQTQQQSCHPQTPAVHTAQLLPPAVLAAPLEQTQTALLPASPWCFMCGTFTSAHNRHKTLERRLGTLLRAQPCRFQWLGSSKQRQLTLLMMLLLPLVALWNSQQQQQQQQRLSSQCLASSLALGSCMAAWCCS